MNSITCPVCGMTSYNPTDIEKGYCGNCHDFTSAVPGFLRDTDEDRPLAPGEFRALLDELLNPPK
jgi:hypothetical protein